MFIERRKKRAEVIIKELKELIPEAKTVLNYSTPLELLIAVILSAQCTDKLVNKVTERLFQKYKTLDDYVNANAEEFTADISSVNFYKNKAKNILATTKLIKTEFDGKIPDSMEKILTLPGVARKTANVVLGILYDKAQGVVVDTHVKRLTKLYGLTDQEDPVKIEKDLIQIIPREEWKNFGFRLIAYGRAYCPARPHDHENCPLERELKGV